MFSLLEKYSTYSLTETGAEDSHFFEALIVASEFGKYASPSLHQLVRDVSKAIEELMSCI